MLTERDAVRTYLEDVQDILDGLQGDDIGRVIDALRDAYRADAQVFIFGNGGSASTASHFVCDLGKNVVVGDRRRFRVIGLADNVAMLTALANDNGYDRVFADQLDSLVRRDDVVVAISASGSSPNVLRAVELARRRGAVTVGLTGFAGGQLLGLCDVCVVVPSDNMGQIENVHMVLNHLVCELLSKEFVETKSPAFAHAEGASR